MFRKVINHILTYPYILIIPILTLPYYLVR